MKFRISGTYKETKKPVEITLEGESESIVRNMAAARGIELAQVFLLNADEPQTVAQDSPAWQEAASNLAGATAAKTRVAVGNTLEALRKLAWNPVKNLVKVFEELGPQKAAQAGIVCAVFFDLAIFLTWLFGRSMAPAGAAAIGLGPHQGFFAFLKVIVGGLIPPVVTTLAMFLSRLGFRGKGRYASDIFVAGVALVPVTLAILVSAVLGGSTGTSNLEIVSAVWVVAACLTVLILYHGFVDLCSLGSALAIYAVPVTILVAMYLSKVIVGMLS